MSLSIHTASAPAFLQILKAFEAVLDKAAAFCEARKVAPEVLLDARLAPDMLPFTRQIDFVTDYPVKAMARLAGKEPQSLEAAAGSFDALKARIAAAIRIVEGVTPQTLEGAETRDITFGVGAGKTMTLPAPAYLFLFILPNFYFHATAAYAILRHNGVDLGKRDFMGV